MRIGVLTLPFNNNYGGYLQAYALMTVLKKTGHDVELINRRHNRISLLFKIRYFIKTLIKMIVGVKCCPLILDQEKAYKKRGELMMPFVDKYISPKTKPLYSTSEIRKECQGKYDVIVVGSDQVWRPEYVPNIENYFLDFIKQQTVRRIAYAASFGERYPKYSNDQVARCGYLLSMFDDVSIREESGVDVMNDFKWQTKKTPMVVLDPTMLLDKTHYEALITSNIPQNKYVFIYVLDEIQEAQVMINAIVTKLDCAEKHIIDTKTWKSPNYKMPSVEDWLRGIHNSEFVITDSFHGTVFSIIFNKPFLVYENNGRGADRFHTLLHHFGLDDRVVSDIADVDMIMRKPINWIDINDRIKEEREKSIMFISNAIE